MAKNTHNNQVGSSVVRSDDRIRETGEIFTPIELCRIMVDEIDEDILRDPSSTFLDNSAGCGNFLIALRDKLCEYHDRDHVLNNMIYAVELMDDNHAEFCETVGVSSDHPHYVCHNALTYEYDFGQPIGLEAFF